MCCVAVTQWESFAHGVHVFLCCDTVEAEVQKQADHELAARQSTSGKAAYSKAITSAAVRPPGT
jgi:hypothetical protein